MENYELIGLQRAEFDSARRIQSQAVAMQLLIAILASLAVFLENSTSAYWVALLSLILTVAWALLDLRLHWRRGQADRARRAVIFAEGLGGSLSSSLNEEIRAGFSNDAIRNAKSFEDKHYFSSKLSPGPNRLILLVEESAFFSRDLMRQSAKLAVGAFIICLSLLIASLFTLSTLTNPHILLNIVRVLCTLLTLAVSVGVLRSTISYMRAAFELDRLLSRFELLRNTDCHLSDLFLSVTDYYSAIERAPLFVPGLYEKRVNLLNKQWQLRIQAEEGRQIPRLL